MKYVSGSVLAPWLVMGLLGGTYVTSASADALAQSAVVHFALPSGALDQVLLQISRQGAVAISFEQNTLRGLKSDAIEGDLTVGQAIDRALQGTGLHQVRSDVGLSIERDAPRPSTQTQLKTVTVVGQARRPDIVGGALGNTTALKTPFSVVEVKSAELEERQVKAMSDVFSGDSSVGSNGNTYSLTASNVTVRGVRLDNGGSYKINGLPVFITTLELPFETFDSVQLLKGASGFMYGFGAPGGVVNYVTKKPTDETKLSVDAGFRSDSVYSEHVDVGGRTGPDAVFGYRLNAVHEEGETPTNSHVHRDSFGLSLDARITPDLTWTADTLYQERLITGGKQNYRLPLYTDSSLPRVPNPRDTQPGIEGTTFDTRMWMVATGLHWNINDIWSGSLDYNHFFQNRHYLSEYPTILNKAGDAREQLNTGDGTADYEQFQAMLQGDFSTGLIGHKLVLGASRQTYDRRSSTTSLGTYIGNTNIYTTPVPINYTGQTDFPTYHVSDIEQRSLFASDTLDLTHGWSLLGGLRSTTYIQDTFNVAGVNTSHYRQVPLTPTIALMYSPRPDTTFYASYVEALEAGSTAGSTYLNSGETLAPVESKQYEVGVKTDRRNWGGSLAVFRLERGAEYGNSAGYYVQNGQQVFKGIELNGRLEATDSTTLASSSTWLDAEFTKGDEDLIGNRVAGASRFQQSLQVSQKVTAVDGLKVYANSTYKSAAQANSANTLEVPSITLFGAGASYRIPVDRHEVTFRASLDNIANRRYWAYASDNSVYLGAPRTVSLNVSFDY